MNRWILVALALFVLLGVGVYLMFGVVMPNQVVTHYSYTGKTFMTGEEYETFKAIIARDDVLILELDVYASDNPLVMFGVVVPADVDFPWAEGRVSDRVYPHRPNLEVLAFLFILLGLFCGAFALGKGLGLDEA
jgi:hypothetical protein